MNQRKKEVLAVTCLATAGVLLIPKLSLTGFRASELLASSPALNYWLSFGVVILGVIDLHRRLRFQAWRGFRSALSCYISLAVAMGGIYYLVHQSHSGCFSFSGGDAVPSIVDFLYFSFITITTVGYGDIVPQHTFVRGLVLFQVLSGLLLIIRPKGCSAS